MIFLRKKAFVLIFILFSSACSIFAADTKDDDIFKNQKIEDGDFYKIVVEPSKKEIENENSAFFESVKQKKLEILKKIENEKQKLNSSKAQLLSAKEKAKAELEKNKANLKNNSAKQTGSADKESAAEIQSEKTDANNESLQKTQANNVAKVQKKNTQQIAKENTLTEAVRKKNLEQQKTKAENKTVEEAEKEMDSTIDKRKKFIDLGMEYKGTTYVWGGKTPTPGFDCSGLISYTAKLSLGIDIKGNAQDIYNQTSPVSLNEALPGDLIFFKGESDTRITHVGIYLGKNPGKNDFGKQNLFLNAASAGPRTGVIISGLNENYWKKTFYGCGRILPSI